MHCAHCRSTLPDHASFCPDCGSLAEATAYCQIHVDKEAAGVCVICHTPCCAACGRNQVATFLCNEHSGYEVFEGMVRVFGSTDNVQAHYVAVCLEEEGLHPFVYSRRFNPGADVAPSIAYRDFGGHIVEELKVLVPTLEVSQAEAVIRTLDLTQSATGI